MVTRIRRGARVHLYITEWRESFDLTLEQLGGRLDVGKNTMWRWETEQNRLNPEKIAAIADALGIDTIDLYFPPGARRVDPLLADQDEKTREDALGPDPEVSTPRLSRRRPLRELRFRGRFPIR